MVTSACGSCRVVPEGHANSFQPAAPELDSGQHCHGTTQAWNLVQVSYRGAYSVERLCAFNEYCRHASLFRVLLVCVLAPILPLVLVLAIEYIPLQSPQLGWQANYIFFGRSLVGVVLVSGALVLQIKNILPDLELNSTECVKISLTTGIVVTGVQLLISRWIFPIPLFMSLIAVPVTGVFMLNVSFIVGSKRMNALTDKDDRLRRTVMLLLVQALLPMLYPTITALYLRLASPAEQLVCVCALPLAKQGLKMLMVRYTASSIDDYIAETIVFSVDAFHGIYLCACLEITKSSWTKFIIIAIDVAHHIISFVGIHRRTCTIRGLFSSGLPAFRKRQLPAIVVDLFSLPNCLNPRAFSKVRLRSCLRYRLSHQAARIIRRLSINHPSLMPKEDDSGGKGEIAAMPRSMLPIPLLLPRQSTDDLLVLADVMPAAGSRRGSSRRKSSLKILRAKSRSLSSFQSTEKSTSSFGSGRMSPSVASTVKVLPRVGTASPSTPLEINSTLLQAAKRHHSLHVYDTLSTDVKTQLAQQSLALLFTTEYLALIEYVELVVPLLYAVYVPVLFTLPNFQFHTVLYETIHDNEVLLTTSINVVIYAALELLSFVGFHVAIKRKLRVSPLYQVAFVLENQIEMIEGKLLAWVLYAVQFPLAHCGGSNV